VEVSISSLNREFRIDAEYFKKDILKYETEILEYKFLKDLGEFLIGPFGSTVISNNYVNNTNNYYIRGLDIGNFFLKEPEARIGIQQFNKLKKFHVKYEDIFITVVGTIGKVSIITDKNIQAIFSNKSTILRTNINPYYLTTFFNTKLGYKLLVRGKRGAIQEGLNLTDLKAIKIPLVSNYFQTQIEKIIKKSHQTLEQSKTLYKQSEEILLKELDLLDFEPTKEKIAIKSFSESFGESGRLDSEYYLPMYDEVINKIKSYKGGYETIDISCNLKHTNYKPQDKDYYQYVELSNIGTTGDITGCTYELGEDLPSRARRKIKENDVIISSIEGSLEKVAIVRKEYDNSLCSTGFYVINSQKINSETLLVLFKNKRMQQILKKSCSGTILTGMNKDEFLNIIIPLIDKTIQIQIEEKIKESFRLKEESKRLLELAKRAVEVAIEEGEDVAMGFCS